MEQLLLNMSKEEKAFLLLKAWERSVSMTLIIRELIQKDMKRAKK